MTEQKTANLMNIVNSYVPSVSAITIIIFCVSLTWFISQERSEIHDSIKEARILAEATTRQLRIDTGRKHDELQQKISQLSVAVERLVKSLANTNTNTFTAKDYILDCIRHELINPGWKCIHSNSYRNNQQQANTEVLPWLKKPSINGK